MKMIRVLLALLTVATVASACGGSTITGPEAPAVPRENHMGSGAG